MKLYSSFIAVMYYIRSKLIFRLFYWFNRVSMAVTFVISGIRKLPGIKFTILPDYDPVGSYFNTMHSLGFYWNFIGYFQILTGLFLLLNRFVAISSIMMMPVTINIMLISFALNMKGTPIITVAMLLSNIFLIIWHFEAYKSVLQRPDVNTTRLFKHPE